MGALRLAIIGGGPRALWAIEELAARAEELPALDIDVCGNQNSPVGQAGYIALISPRIG